MRLKANLNWLIWTPVSFLHAIDVSIRDDCNRGQPQLGIIQWPRNIVPNGMIISIWCLKSSSRIFYDLFLCNWKKCMVNLYRLYIPYIDGWGVTTTGFSETPMTATCTRPYRDLKIHGDPWQNLVNPYPQLGSMGRLWHLPWLLVGFAFLKKVTPKNQVPFQRMLWINRLPV